MLYVYTVTPDLILITSLHQYNLLQYLNSLSRASQTPIYSALCILSRAWTIAEDIIGAGKVDVDPGWAWQGVTRVIHALCPESVGHFAKILGR